MFRQVALAVMALLVMASSATAQTYQGSVRGIVGDAQGVIPGVEVTLTNEATNVSRTVVSDEVGEYAFASVLPGIYAVKVCSTASGRRSGVNFVSARSNRWCRTSS